MKLAGLALFEFNHLAEKVFRQKADAVGKEAKEQAHEKVRDGLRVMAALLKTGGELGKLHRRRFRDAGGGALRAELLRAVKVSLRTSSGGRAQLRPWARWRADRPR